MDTITDRVGAICKQHGLCNE